MRPSRSASAHSSGRIQSSPDGRGVPLVEDEVDDFEHRREPRGAVFADRNLERDVRVGDRLLRPHDALGDRRLGHEIRARDLGGREAADEPQRERDPRLDREHRVARDEDEPEHVVVDVVGEGAVEVGHARRRAPRRDRVRSRRTCARAAGRAGTGRWRAACRRSSATRPRCAAHPTRATARARRRARPARAPRRGRRRRCTARARR